MNPEEATLYIERDSDQVDSVTFCGGQVAAFSRSSAETDGPNQDVAALIPYGEDRGVLLVADGAGGQRGGGQASATTAYELCAAMEQGARIGTRLREAILDGIESADREVQTLAIGAGTTLALVELDGTRVRSFHVGDSQVVVLGQRGRVKLLTKSHSPVGYAEFSGYLDEDEAIRHEDRHYVSNLLGTQDMTIEIGAYTQLSSMDTLLIASDGLFDNLTVGEIVEHLRKGALDEATQAMVDACLERMRQPTESRPGKPDDLTVITYRPRAQQASTPEA